MTLEGIIAVNKPAGWTSHDVVAKLRRITKERRIGHTGTLDPEVTGVLPLCIGRATRLVEYIQELPKQYEAELTIGVATDTEDRTGSIIAEAGEVKLTESQIRDAIRSFIGDIEQVPPMYSAVRVDGKRLYELARSGKEVERKPRTVTVHDIELLRIDALARHPIVRFRVTCSKGTYIRTLCVDIGKALGYPAHMSDLVRTATGFITLERCFAIEELARMAEDGRLQEAIIPADEAIAHFPSIMLSVEDAAYALQGRAVRVSDIHDRRLYRAYGPSERFLGVFRFDGRTGELKPEKVFN